MNFKHQIVKILTSENRSFHQDELYNLMARKFMYRGNKIEFIKQLKAIRQNVMYNRQAGWLRFKSDKNVKHKRSTVQSNFGILSSIYEFKAGSQISSLSNEDFITLIANRNVDLKREFIELQIAVSHPVETIIGIYEKSLDPFPRTKFNSDKIQLLHDEIVRDNNISEIERKLLESKLEEYNEIISLEDIEKNGLISYHLFWEILKIVCSNIQLNKFEELFIEEKSIEYGIPRRSKKDMIDSVLLRNKIHSFFLKSENLKYCYLFFIIKFLNIKAYYYDSFFKILDDSNFSISKIENYYTQALDKLKDKLATYDNEVLNIAITVSNLLKIFYASYSIPYSKELQNDLLTGVTIQKLLNYGDKKNVVPEVDLFNNVKGETGSINAATLKKILDQEKRRIGSPDAQLFSENIKFRLRL